MIISASRRSDIPAFYAEWFLNRLREGYCIVPNPFNPAQVSRVSLRPDDVDVIVFWTRNPRPILLHLEELDKRGYLYYFQYTLLDYPRAIDPRTPPLDESLESFRILAEHIGPERVIWRYDPILFSNVTDLHFHKERFNYIAKALKGRTHRAVISIVDIYRKARKRLEGLSRKGVKINACRQKELEDLMRAISHYAQENGMEVRSCAEERDFLTFGIRPGKCVDGEFISKIFGLEIEDKKDPSQRKDCGCVVSKDIGMYDSCLSGCLYCYATTSLEQARINYCNHDSKAPSLLS